MDCFSNKQLIFAIFGFLFLSTCKRDQVDIPYTEISSPTTCDLRAVQFTDTIGFACGGTLFEKSELLRTIDGGNSWQRIPLPTQNVSTEILYGLDLQANGTLIVVGYAGATYRSSNFADSISYSQDPAYAKRTGVCFITPQRAMSCGQNDFDQGILTPLHKNNNWTFPWNPYQHSFGMNHIAFADSMHGYVAGFGAVYKSTDGGKNWNFTKAKNDHFTATTWFTPKSGIAIGWEGSILKTTDGGDHWEKIRSANRVGQKRWHLKCIAQNAHNEIVAAGENGCLVYSTDQGNSWKKIENVPTANFEGVAFQNEDTFFAVAKGGRIFKFQL